MPMRTGRGNCTSRCSSKRCKNASWSRRRSRRKFRFKNKLMSLDGSIIELSATMFDWAKYTDEGRDQTASAAGPRRLPANVRSGDGGQRQRDQRGADLRLKAGTILAVDRGYKDYEWFGS